MYFDQPCRQLVYPTLKQLVERSGTSLKDYLDALRSLLHHAYGERHQILSAKQRSNRLRLQQLINVLDQFCLIENVQVFDLGFKCPEQLNAYKDCLNDTIPMARNSGADLLTLAYSREVSNFLLEIHTEVIRSYGALS
jgi:hypothetical protein